MVAIRTGSEYRQIRQFPLMEHAMANATPEQKPTVTLQGVVEKIIPENIVGPEKAQISVHGAEHMYRELRVDNVLQDEDGEKVALKPGAVVEVTIEAEKSGTTPKK
jgi:hypothetical protein